MIFRDPTRGEKKAVRGLAMVRKELWRESGLKFQPWPDDELPFINYQCEARRYKILGNGSDDRYVLEFTGLIHNSVPIHLAEVCRANDVWWWIDPMITRRPGLTTAFVFVQDEPDDHGWPKGVLERWWPVD